MRYLIAGLMAFLLAATADGRTTAGQALPVKTEPGQPLEVTVISGALGATVFSGAVEVTKSATIHLDSVKAEDSVAGAGDDLFPVAYEVDVVLPVPGSFTDGDYKRPKIDQRGVVYVAGSEVKAGSMESRGSGIFGTPATTVTDAAARPIVWRQTEMGDSLVITNLSAGVWITAGIPMLNVTGDSDEAAAYARLSGTTFTISGGESGFAAHVKIVNEIASVEDVIVTAVTPTIYAATAYVVSGTVGNVMEFTNAVRVSAQGGALNTVTLIDDAGQEAAMVIYFFDQAITPSPDTLPIAISEGDMENCIGIVSFAAGNYESNGTGSVAMRSGLGMMFKADATSIFAVMKTKGTPNYAAIDDLTVKLGIGSD